LNTDKISKEADAKAAIEDDFKEFKKGINPNLLFESLEALIVLLKDSPDKAENLTDNFSSIYRYILTQKNSELGSLEDEIIVLEELVSLFNYLPYRKIKLEYDFSETIAIVPCTLLQVVETIVKTTVVSEEKTIAVSIYEEENGLCISYSPEEKLRESLELSSLSEISKRYEFYSNQKIQLVEKDTIKSIILPKLNYKEAS
jgi:LytS/YehU family sensor histidine kinase